MRRPPNFRRHDYLSVSPVSQRRISLTANLRAACRPLQTYTRPPTRPDPSATMATGHKASPRDEVTCGYNTAYCVRRCSTFACCFSFVALMVSIGISAGGWMSVSVGGGTLTAGAQ